MPRLRTSTGATLAYDDVGDGTPVVAVHGAYSARQEVRGFLDPALPGTRRLYPDLPGMGDSTADGIDDVSGLVTALAELVAHTLGDAPFAVVGHSFGAHLGRGLAARLPRQVRGLALLCPVVLRAADDGPDPEPHVVLLDDGTAARELTAEQRAEYDAYVVVRTAATVARFREHVLPVLGRYDAEAVERVTSGALPVAADGDSARPVLVLAGRHDATAGYRRTLDLVHVYPRATVAVLGVAGHALPHEQPEMLAAMLRHWMTQVDAAVGRGG